MEFDHEEKVDDPAEQLDDFVIQANCDKLVRSYCTTQGIYFSLEDSSIKGKIKDLIG